jgi:hypothetical protein
MRHVAHLLPRRGPGLRHVKSRGAATVATGAPSSVVIIAGKEEGWVRKRFHGVVMTPSPNAHVSKEKAEAPEEPGQHISQSARGPPADWATAPELVTANFRETL